jgi:hypothetical protein
VERRPSSFAIIQLGYPLRFHWLPAAEVVASLAAVTAVGLGIVASQRGRWLLQRHRAERYRMLKFRILVDPHLWTGRMPDEVDRLEREARAIETASTASLRQWMEADEIPDPPDSAACQEVPADVRSSLVRYYRETRLAAQISYFSRRADENLRKDLPVRFLPAAFFFASVIAALLHFAGDLVAGGEQSHEWSVALIVLAAAFPVVGATARTLRLAHEYSRNTSRFRAKLVVLRRLSDALATETAGEVEQGGDHAGKEERGRQKPHQQVLESEHREWLRLMLNGEWFG